MRIQNNISAINTHRQYGVNQSNVAKSVEKLSSGYRVNRAGDDAAGLAISEKMRAQIRGLTQASRNTQDTISLIQTAEGALQSTTNMLQRMRELAVQSANDTNDGDGVTGLTSVSTVSSTTKIDRTALQLEFAQLQSEIDDVASKTIFNKKKLLDGSINGSGGTGTGTTFVAQIGANKVDQMSFDIEAMSTGSLGIDASEIATQSGATQAIEDVDTAINRVSLQRASLGAIQNRLEYKTANLDTSAENLQAAESRIRDVDMAKEMTTFMKHNILAQASTAMLAQANSLPQGVLSLIG